MDRRTRVTHPDGTFEQFVYTNLDLIASCDRLGRWTTNTYNADRQLVQTRDPLGRVTAYDWCKCGSMTGLTDPMGNTTTWDYDVESRPIAKHYVDGSTVRYVYENTTSRLKYRFDEKTSKRFMSITTTTI
jgi:YD repeat-containing protein